MDTTSQQHWHLSLRNLLNLSVPYLIWIVSFLYVFTLLKITYLAKQKKKFSHLVIYSCEMYYFADGEIDSSLIKTLKGLIQPVVGGEYLFYFKCSKWLPAEDRWLTLFFFYLYFHLKSLWNGIINHKNKSTTALETWKGGINLEGFFNSVEQME